MKCFKVKVGCFDRRAVTYRERIVGLSEVLGLSLKSNRYRFYNVITYSVNHLAFW
jgi:hypothetical protein